MKNVITKELIAKILSDIANNRQFEEIYEYGEKNHWQVFLDEGIFLDLDFNETSSCSFISASIGLPDANNASKLYEMLLIYNGQWAKSDGLFLSMNESAGNIYLAFQLNAGHVIDAKKLETVFLWFFEKVLTWRSYIDNQGKNKSQHDADEILSENTIRV